ncbi:MAG TPA: LuxR C-terminal-related transcriptional regulator, partial [Pseudonocardiaceae bacterium]
PAVVAALVDRSSISAAHDAGTGPVRYRQLNTVRAYAVDQLAGAGDADQTMLRAVDWLVRLVEPITRMVHLPDSMLEQLRRDRDNIAAAVDFTTADDDRHMLLAVALARVWQEEDLGTAGRRLLTRALARAPGSVYRAEALAMIAEIACRQGELDQALRSADAAVRLERDREQPIGLARALHVLAFTRLCRGEQTMAIAAQRECLDIVNRFGDEADIALVTSNLAWQLLQAGQDLAAERLLCGRASAGRKLRALPRAHAAAMHTIGALRLAQDDLDAAEESFVEGLCRTPPESLDGAPLIEGLAVIDARRGDPERALCLAAAAGAIRGRLGVVASAEWRHQVERATAAARRRLNVPRAAAATAAGEAIQGPALRSYALRHLVGPPDEVVRRTDQRLLTDREFEIVTLVADGLTNREIADRLHRSVGTVRAAVTALLNKLYLRSRIQLAVWAATRDADVS